MKHYKRRGIEKYNELTGENVQLLSDQYDDAIIGIGEDGKACYSVVGLHNLGCIQLKVRDINTKDDFNFVSSYVHLINDTML